MRRLLRLVVILAVVVVGLLAQAGAYLFGFTTPAADASAGPGLGHAAPGEHAVGVRRIGADEASLAMTVWYPATTSDQPPATYSYALTVLGPGASTALATDEGVARLGAAPDLATGPFPLVLLSSGFAITPGSYAWLAEHLASHGMVVVAPRHRETLDPRRLWRAAIDRPADIARTREYVEGQARRGWLSGLVDTGSVAVLGHSWGGYTALASGGARLDADAFTAGCEGARADDPIVFLCDALEPRFDDIVAVSSHDTEPVDAVVSLAGDAAMFGQGGLGSLTAPLLVMGGTADHDSPYDWTTRLAFDSAASERKVEAALEGAGHFVFSGRCGSVRRVVALVGGLCADQAWDRGEAQAVVRHLVTAFLLAELVDDDDARATLSDAPDLSGVQVRARGY